MSSLTCGVVTLVRSLILLVYLCAGNQVMRVHWGPEANSLISCMRGRRLHVKLAPERHVKSQKKLKPETISDYLI